MPLLSINPIIRSRIDKAPLIEATEDQVRRSVWMKKPGQRMLFLREGLIDTQCFPSYYGAFFVLNFERYREGRMSEDQLDRFVDILLDKIQIPYLKAVHPQADIEGHFATLLRDRRCNSRESHLVDRIDQHGRLPSWNGARKAFNDPRASILHLVTQCAPIAIAIGHKPAVVLEQLQQEIGKAVAELDVHPALKPSLLDRYLDHFMIGYPELWPAIGLDAAWFLGERMIKNHGCGGYCEDKSVVNGSAGKPVIRKGGETYAQDMADFFLDYLAAIDPTVLDAEHLILDGSRSKAWLDRCPNIESRLDILERLMQYGIPHPALNRIEGLAGKLSAEGQQSVILEYLKYGSKVTERLTMAIIEMRSEMHGWAFERCRGYAAVARLAKLKKLTGEQIGRLEPSVKRRLLEVDLGV